MEINSTQKTNSISNEQRSFESKLNIQTNKEPTRYNLTNEKNKTKLHLN